MGGLCGWQFWLAGWKPGEQQLGFLSVHHGRGVLAGEPEAEWCVPGEYHCASVWECHGLPAIFGFVF